MSWTLMGRVCGISRAVSLSQSGSESDPVRGIDCWTDLVNLKSYWKYASSPSLSLRSSFNVLLDWRHPIRMDHFHNLHCRWRKLCHWSLEEATSGLIGGWQYRKLLCRIKTPLKPGCLWWFLKRWRDTGFPDRLPFLWWLYQPKHGNSSERLRRRTLRWSQRRCGNHNRKERPMSLVWGLLVGESCWLKQAIDWLEDLHVRQLKGYIIHSELAINSILTWQTGFSCSFP